MCDGYGVFFFFCSLDNINWYLFKCICAIFLKNLEVYIHHVFYIPFIFLKKLVSSLHHSCIRVSFWCICICRWMENLLVINPSYIMWVLAFWNRSLQSYYMCIFLIFALRLPSVKLSSKFQILFSNYFSLIFCVNYIW